MHSQAAPAARVERMRCFPGAPVHTHESELFSKPWASAGSTRQPAEGARQRAGCGACLHTGCAGMAPWPSAPITHAGAALGCGCSRRPLHCVSPRKRRCQAPGMLPPLPCHAMLRSLTIQAEMPPAHVYSTHFSLFLSTYCTASSTKDRSAAGAAAAAACCAMAAAAGWECEGVRASLQGGAQGGPGAELGSATETGQLLAAHARSHRGCASHRAAAAPLRAAQGGSGGGGSRRRPAAGMTGACRAVCLLQPGLWPIWDSPLQRGVAQALPGLGVQRRGAAGAPAELGAGLGGLQFDRVYSIRAARVAPPLTTRPWRLGRRRSTALPTKCRAPAAPSALSPHPRHCTAAAAALQGGQSRAREPSWLVTPPPLPTPQTWPRAPCQAPPTAHCRRSARSR